MYGLRRLKIVELSKVRSTSTAGCVMCGCGSVLCAGQLFWVPCWLYNQPRPHRARPAQPCGAGGALSHSSFHILHSHLQRECRAKRGTASNQTAASCGHRLLVERGSCSTSLLVMPPPRSSSPRLARSRPTSPCIM
eukprot:COSAG01_NODE_1911_length_8925_cov_151.747111_11_plen_136_part_00